MTTTLLETVANVGGIGGLLAVLMFFVMLRVMRVMREDRKFMEDRLTKLLEADHETRNDNTKVLTELVTLLNRLNGRAR